MPINQESTPIKADKVLYFWQPIYKYRKTGVEKKIEMLGLQGASSTTNTKSVQTTQLKTGTIKTIGQTNQQRIVAVIFDKEGNLYHRLYDAWEKGGVIGLWRVDMNDIKGDGDSRTVSAEFAECLIPALPSTEALNGILTANITFEVQHETRTLDENGDPFRLDVSDFENPSVLDEASQFFYDFSHGMKPQPKPTPAKVDESKINNSLMG